MKLYGDVHATATLLFVIFFNDNDRRTINDIHELAYEHGWHYKGYEGRDRSKPPKYQKHRTMSFNIRLDLTKGSQGLERGDYDLSDMEYSETMSNNHYIAVMDLRDTQERRYVIKEKIDEQLSVLGSCKRIICEI